MRRFKIPTIATNRWALWVALAGLGPAVLRAELVYFARGGRVQVPARSAPDGTVILEVPGGPAAFPRDEFRKIVPGYSPASDWPRRCAAARTGGAEARFAAAWW